MHKTRLKMTLAKSKDSVIRVTAPTLATGRRWPAQNAGASLHHSDIVGQEAFEKKTLRYSMLATEAEQRR